MEDQDKNQQQPYGEVEDDQQQNHVEDEENNQENLEEIKPAGFKMASPEYEPDNISGENEGSDEAEDDSNSASPE